MGLALVIGVATKIWINKEENYLHYTREEILDDLKDELNFDLYNIDEDEDNVYLIPKEDIFVSNIHNLLFTETKNFDWDDEERERYNKILDRIKKAKNIEKVKSIVKEDGSYYLHLMNPSPWEAVSYISKKRLPIYTELLVYELSYKVLFESYFEIFKYLRDKIRNSIDNPLKDNIFLMITTG